MPVVHAVEGADLVLERLDGPTMSTALETGQLDVPSAAVMLADLHASLHALPARPGCDPQDRVLHLDLHPDNVMLEARGPVVIDWCNSSDGPADLDIAMTALILAQVAADDADARAPLAHALMRDFLVHVDGNPLRLLAEVVTRREADANITAAERGRLTRAAALVREQG